MTFQSTITEHERNADNQAAHIFPEQNVACVCCGCVAVDQTSMCTPVKNRIENNCSGARLRTCLYITSLTGLMAHDLYYPFLYCTFAALSPQLLTEAN